MVLELSFFSDPNGSFFNPRPGNGFYFYPNGSFFDPNGSFFDPDGFFFNPDDFWWSAIPASNLTLQHI